MNAPKLNVTAHGDAIVAALAGELEFVNMLDFADELLRHVPNEAVGLVVDLSAVRYLDSAGIRTLFEVSRRLANCRQGLALTLPEQSPLRRLLAVTRMEGAAIIDTNVDDAILGLRRSAADRI